MRNALIVAILTVFIVKPVRSQDLPQVKIVTSLGEIVVEADTIRAPATALNFLYHVKKGTYTDAAFYRTVRLDNQPDNKVKIEVIQGGLFDEELINKISPIKHESTEQTGMHHIDGTVSMARSEPGTASTEFFICIGNQPELDFGGKRNPDRQGFAAFGRVLKGMDVVRKIQQQKEKDQYLLSPLKIESIVMM